jgi:PEP-CTERM motif
MPPVQLLTRAKPKGSFSMRLKILTIAASASLLAAHGASADTIVPVKQATVTGAVTVCGPCGGADAISASQSNVPLSQYGVNYSTTSFNPSLEQSGLNTPGELTVSEGGATATESITTKDPSFTATVSGGVATENPAFYSQGGVPTGTSFDYYFKVIDPADPTSTASTTVYVTARGGLNISTSAFPGSYGSLNSGQALAELLITPGPGNTTLEELAQVNYGYYYPPGGTCQCTTTGTSNVTATLGPSSSASGGWTLSASPVTVNLDTPYEVELSVALTGSYLVDGTAYVDPIITPSASDEIFFSPGIANGVPEPSTWAMMIVGFVGLGFLALRRRQRGGDRCLS